jgi:hypothetical protein
MNEMTNNKETILGGSVKKTLLVAALVAMLVFAFSGAAFAAGINHTGQQRLGNAATAPANGYNQDGSANLNIAGAGTNTYMDWNKALGDNATNGNSPHGNYTTTTVKCVVCHAVHYAGANGAPVGSSTGVADTLLRVRADSACVLCHATTGQAVNGRPVYNGLGGVIVGPGNTGGATDNGHITGTNCTYCHTNVHGANADNSVASLQGFLLKNMTATNVQGTGATTNDMIDAITAIDHNAVNQGFAAGAALNGTIGQYATVNNHALYGEQAVGIFCAECHNGAYATAAAGASTNVLNAGSAVAYSGHRIAAAATSTWNSDGSKSTGLVQNQAVAWAAADNCKSCHDATDDFNNAAFPHSWGKSGVNSSKMWLLTAADAGATKTSVGQASATAYNSTTNPVQLTDGVCLKCHVASGGAEGVGITF